MSERDAVRVRLCLLAEDDLPSAELLWATPIDDGGCFRLESHAFLAALAAGDVVRAEPDAAGDLRVVDVVEPADAVLTLVGRVWGAEVDLEAVLERWRAAGARRTEGCAGALATVWAEGMTPQAVVEVMRPELAAGTFELLEVSLPEHRTRAALADDVLFDLDDSGTRST